MHGALDLRSSTVREHSTRCHPDCIAVRFGSRKPVSAPAALREIADYWRSVSVDAESAQGRRLRGQRSTCAATSLSASGLAFVETNSQLNSHRVVAPSLLSKCSEGASS